jgi:hypothetical protein
MSDSEIDSAIVEAWVTEAKKEIAEFMEDCHHKRTSVALFDHFVRERQ